MAIYWNLGLKTRTREDADACVAFFREKQLRLDDVDVLIEVHLHESKDGWLVGVWPRGMSHAAPSGDDPRLTTDAARAQIERTFDAWLLEAPRFAAAFFGGEAFDFFLDAEESIDADGIPGLFVDEETWVSLGRPPIAARVGAGRFAWPRASDLWEACYRGQLEIVRALLAAGADPNAIAGTSGREWIPPHPRPLTCVAIAWSLNARHVEIARLLIAHGAIVDADAEEQHGLEMVGSAHDCELQIIFWLGRNKPDPAAHVLLEVHRAGGGEPAAAIAAASAGVEAARDAGAQKVWVGPLATMTTLWAVTPLTRAAEVEAAMARWASASVMRRPLADFFEASA